MRKLLAATAGAALLAQPSFGEVVARHEGGLKIKNEVLVSASPDEIWSAFIRDTNEWWQVEHHWFGADSRVFIEERSGGCFCEIGPRNQQAAHLMVTFLRPFDEIRMAGALGPFQREGVAGGLVVKLTPEGDGTKVSWSYALGGYVDGGLAQWADAVDDMHGTQLQRLKKFVETGSAR